MATLSLRDNSDRWTDQSYLNPYPSPLDDFWSLSLDLNPLFHWTASPFPNDKEKSMPRIPAFHFPPSPSETCSSVSTDLSPSPEPVATRVICDVPLLAPRPLPYHSPTFLQFDLPDSDEDLSYPPYCDRPSKRKREDDTHQSENLRIKRHAGVDRWAARVHRQAWCGTLPTQGHSHVYSATRRHRLR
ncbi:hypothetical protein AZE42_04823 [Rhizopogon vesiculosus]|uniref:Uncharacterized protein n=1 Tax=Rhizopogon vesiculosus TaxID=180088 RepID=A0A1J8Q713_9AGAM|nr:hypothetical protein AZE42_04823 [Rhizopogon vesiculosus]